MKPAPKTEKIEPVAKVPKPVTKPVVKPVAKPKQKAPIGKNNTSYCHGKNHPMGESIRILSGMKSSLAVMI